MIEEERTRGDTATPKRHPTADEIPGRLQLPQRPADRHLALREALGQRLDGDRGTIRQGLDVDAEADRRGGEARVLGEVVADDGVALGAAVPYVEHSGAGCVLRERRERRERREFRRRGRRVLGRRVRGQGRVRLRISHWEGHIFLVGQALAGIAVLPGAVLCLRLCAATVPHPPDPLTVLSPERVAPQLAHGQAGLVGLVVSPKAFKKLAHHRVTASRAPVTSCANNGRWASRLRSIARPHRDPGATWRNNLDEARKLLR